MLQNNILPKDLPQSDPLLFSFLTIVQAADFPIRFWGGFPSDKDKPTPCFEFAVNSWTVGEDANGYKQVTYNVLAAIWKDQPFTHDKLVFDKCPNGAVIRRVDLSYSLPYEELKTTTFYQLNSIIQALEQSKELQKRFGWEIQDESIQFVAAKNSTANKYYGVGAQFDLIGTYTDDCCKLINMDKLTGEYFSEKGYINESC